MGKLLLVNQKKLVKKESAETSRDWDFKVREQYQKVDFNYDTIIFCDTKRI
jgi:hypothetical protein